MLSSRLHIGGRTEGIANADRLRWDSIQFATSRRCSSVGWSSTHTASITGKIRPRNTAAASSSFAPAPGIDANSATAMVTAHGQQFGR
jgi:hypothetical protein